MPTNLEALSDRVGKTWETIEAARETAAAKRGQIVEKFSDLTSEDSSIVVFGSLARDEFTSGSDIDWALLIDGQADPGHWDAALKIGKDIHKFGKDPGREGTFGATAFSHDLIHLIGGEDDTNRNLTQRTLLLLESASIGRPDAYGRVVRAVLDRYIHEDFGWLHSSDQANVPRFLQNDIVRYWRTVAVDFAYKRRQRAREGWAIRTAKLRISRKLTYAAGLTACFRCASIAEEQSDFRSISPEERANRLVAELESFLSQTPLEMVLWAYLRFDKTPAAVTFCDVYDSFLAMLNNEGDRKRLEDLPAEEAQSDPTFQNARELGHEFQACLNELFLPGDGSGFEHLTRKYGVF